MHSMAEAAVDSQFTGICMSFSSCIVTGRNSTHLCMWSLCLWLHSLHDTAKPQCFHPLTCQKTVFTNPRWQTQKLKLWIELPAELSHWVMHAHECPNQVTASRCWELSHLVLLGIRQCDVPNHSHLHVILIVCCHWWEFCTPTQCMCGLLACDHTHFATQWTFVG